MKPEQILYDGVVRAALAGGAIEYIASEEGSNLVTEYKKYGLQRLKSANDAVDKYAKAAIKRSKLIIDQSKPKASKRK